MPRKPRLDCPDLLYHIIVRGIDRGLIFKDDADRDAFLSRLGDILKDTSTPIYAFCLMPNHFHLLLRRGKTPISTVMQRLLTGYAIYFNKRHKRVGHLFQNRYKDIVCQDDAYFLELVRYIHLNLLRAKIVDSIDNLKTYQFSGHPYILGLKKADWFCPDTVLSHFAKTENKARLAYLKFLSEASDAKREDLVGGGLRRSLGFPKQYPKQRQLSDDRILGDGGFVEKILKDNANPLVAGKNLADPLGLISQVCREFDVLEAELLGASRAKRVADARAYLAYKMSKEAGLSGSDIARRLGITRSAACKMIKKGEIIKTSQRS